MTTLFKRAIILAAILSLISVAGVGCKKKGTFENTGKTIDKTLDKAKKKIHNATD